MRARRFNSPRQHRPPARLPAYVLIAVMLLVGLGAVLSFSFIAAHANVPVETSLDSAYQRAIRAAQTGLNIAVRQIRTTPMTTNPSSDSLEEIWNDHWGYDGVIIALGDYDASASAATNRDLVGIEVRRYADDDLGNTEYADAVGASQFNYHPEFYKITCIGVARDSQNRNLAYYALRSVARIPRSDWTFRNLLLSSNGYPQDSPLAVFSSAWAGRAPIFLDRSCYVAGHVYSWYHVNIHNAVTITGDAYFDDQPPPGAPSPSGQPGNDGWVPIPGGAKRMILPPMTLADYGHTNLKYKIDGVTFQADNLGATQRANANALELGSAPSKTNPANVLVYGGGADLTLDAKNFKITCRGTIVADTIVVTDTSNTEDASGVDHHFSPALPGFPSIVCNTLEFGRNDPEPQNRTFLEGPVLVREYIEGDRRAGATIRGFIINNDQSVAPPSGQGSYKGEFYVVAEEGDPPQPGPYTELRIVDGSSYDATPDRGMYPPEDARIIRTRSGDNDILFSTQFLAGHTWPP